jgi:serine/threonine protein kinase
MIKLGDFGISRILSCTMSRAYTYVGTPFYLAPEIITKSDYGFEADIWALGVLFYEMAALDLPFKGSTIIKLGKRICAGRYKPLPDRFS